MTDKAKRWSVENIKEIVEKAKGAVIKLLDKLGRIQKEKNELIEKKKNCNDLNEIKVIEQKLQEKENDLNNLLEASKKIEKEVERLQNYLIND